MLTAFQERIARLFLRIPEASNFALAGGGALISWNAVDRQTKDLDFFAPVQEEILVATERFKAVLRQENVAFQVIRSSPAFVRWTVSDPRSEEEILVDIGRDYRLREPVPTALGPVLTLEELAADKLLALFGRAEARDFIDIYFLSRKLDINTILRLAREKDPGLDRHVLAGMIGH